MKNEDNTTDIYEICLYHTGTIFQTVVVKADDFAIVGSGHYVVFNKNEKTIAVFNLKNIIGFKKLDT